MTCSFETFLVRYCNQLTGTGKRVRSIAKLAGRCGEHPRAYEPVTVLAALWGRGDTLLAAVDDPDRRSGCAAFLEGYAESGGSLVGYLEGIGRADPRERHYRALEAWRAEPALRETDEGVKEGLSRKIAAEVGRMGICESARACGVNKGNLWAFARGDTSKMSLMTAFETLDALREHRRALDSPAK